MRVIYEISIWKSNNESAAETLLLNGLHKEDELTDFPSFCVLNRLLMRRKLITAAELYSNLTHKVIITHIR